jgi:hypothetical protein
MRERLCKSAARSSSSTTELELLNVSFAGPSTQSCSDRVLPGGCCEPALRKPWRHGEGRQHETAQAEAAEEAISPTP